MSVPFDFGFWTREEAEEPFVPTAEDQVEWVMCDDCGEDYPVVDGLGSCDCHMGFEDREVNDDFPMSLEYDSPWGIGGDWDY